MSSEPLVTTIITCYNKAPWIEQCIRSVLSQSIADSEVLVIDDASTDGSVEIVRRLEAENAGRLRAIFHRENKGLFGGFCGRDSGIGPAQRAKTTIWN